MRVRRPKLLASAAAQEKNRLIKALSGSHLGVGSESDMSEPQLQFHFRDSDSRDAADELAQFLANELPDWQPRVEEQVLLVIG